MKHLLHILSAALIFCLFSACAEVPSAPDPASLTSRSCILIDSITGEVLFEKDADARRYPASTTKIMTLLISIQRVDSEKMVTVPESASNVTFDSTRVPVYPGEKMPMRDLWYGLIYKSGNDAANAIATLTCGSVDAFVEEMNACAKKLGMNGTHYANAHGLTNTKHYTTARDMATLTRYALEYDLFREITFSTNYVMQPTSLRGELPITHLYGITDFTSTYYYKYARGIKTGYTAAAGQCYVGAAVKGNHELIAVCLNAGGLKPQKWQDAAKLFKYGFAVLEDRDSEV